jgi:cellulose synthase/poly-beta-1,6-N-acetylglucosamine synthase-like glycosyltransferase
MTQSQVVILGIYAAIIAIWPIRMIVLEVVIRRLGFLSPMSPRYRQSTPPLVTAMLPARNEEQNLARCLESLSAQDYPNLEIIVVDDRSTDRTAQIADRASICDARIRVIRNERLPAGWTGKAHALHQAVAQAQGQWFWFIDADTHHAPESLSTLMEYARIEDASLVSLLPELRCESFWEQVVQPLAGITLMQSFPLHVVNNDRSRLAFANGQFILIERSAYLASGGHELVRDRFVEDIALARQAKSLGMRVRVAMSHGLVTCRMYSSLEQLTRGWSRIFYDALDRKAWRISVNLLDGLILSQTAHLAIVAGAALAILRPSAFACWLVGLSIAHHLWMYLVFRRVYRTSVPGSRYARWYPLGNLVVDLILLAAMRMCFTGRVTWRGTHYNGVTTQARARSSIS